MAGTVLIVDDEAVIRDALAWILPDEGYSVRTASDGAPALQQITRVPEPMVVLLDLTMPLIDGFAVLTALERRDARVSRHAFIIVTARSGRLPLDQRARFLRLGIPVFGKPFDLDQLLAAIARAAQQVDTRSTQVG